MISTPAGATTPRPRKPGWLKRPIAFQGKQQQVQEQIAAAGLHTVCREARCPNRSECFARGTATFLVMGAVCTRGCIFCSVGKGAPASLDWSEIDRIVDAAGSMKLGHVVITSVTRDDLPDGGASFLATLVEAFRSALPAVTVELLIPDLGGSEDALAVVFKSRPAVLNHNVETVPSLYPVIRPQADYRRSLAVLRQSAAAGLVTKSGLMVGLGEKPEEIQAVLDDLHTCGCAIVTIGQYLQPSPEQTAVVTYVSPEQFKTYQEYGEKKGVFRVVSGPFVRSSYNAAEVVDSLRRGTKPAQ
jgi:lipoyl synthase